MLGTGHGSYAGDSSPTSAIAPSLFLRNHVLGEAALKHSSQNPIDYSPTFSDSAAKNNFAQADLAALILQMCRILIENHDKFDAGARRTFRPIAMRVPEEAGRAT